jgi:hypothetical protein
VCVVMASWSPRIHTTGDLRHRHRIPKRHDRGLGDSHQQSPGVRRTSRYQGPGHRSLSQPCWPDTSGLLSCRCNRTPAGGRRNRAVPKGLVRFVSTISDGPPRERRCSFAAASIIRTRSNAVRSFASIASTSCPPVRQREFLHHRPSSCRVEHDQRVRRCRPG